MDAAADFFKKGTAREVPFAYIALTYIYIYIIYLSLTDALSLSLSLSFIGSDEEHFEHDIQCGRYFAYPLVQLHFLIFSSFDFGKKNCKIKFV